MRDLVPFVQFKKREHPWKSVNFSKVADFNLYKINTPPWVFLKLYKWYQIAQRITFHHPTLPKALRFRPGKGSNLRNISIGSCYEALGSCRANALLDFRTFTVCD